MASVFPAPDHDHARCSADAMAHAEAICAERGERLTPMRRRVLETLAASHKPLGAYEIMDEVARSGPRAAPITWRIWIIRTATLLAIPSRHSTPPWQTAAFTLCKLTRRISH